MRAATPDSDQLRRLAETRADRPVVLSLYLNLDPQEFATPPARETAIRSLLDDAAAREIEGADADDRKSLEAALERARPALEDDLPAEGAGAVAVFASEPLDLLEVVPLPQPVPSRAAIGRAPLVGPLAAADVAEDWCVVLVNREVGRVLRGGPGRLEEVRDLRDDVRGQHDQGGWSQGRYERSVDKEVAEHFADVAELVSREYGRHRFERLLAGGPHESLPEFESKLEPEIAQRVAGRLDVDVENTNADQVLEAARPVMDEVLARNQQELLERIGGPATASGRDDVLAALNERRVETLLVSERIDEEAASCPTCGWTGPGGIGECPADGTALEPAGDLRESAIALALGQDARVVSLPAAAPALDDRDGMAAVLRF